MNSNSKSTNLAAPKLRDDWSNWPDYEPRLRIAMGSKGLWRHIEGTAVVPKPYIVADGIPVLPDRKTPATVMSCEASYECKPPILRVLAQEHTTEHIPIDQSHLHLITHNWRRLPSVLPTTQHRSSITSSADTGRSLGRVLTYKLPQLPIQKR